MERVHVAAALAATGLALVAGRVHAQVLEIGAGGRVTTYAGPAVITAEGVRPLTAAAPAARPEVEREIAQAARDYGLRREVVRAVAVQESGLRQGARSPKGAVGVMQLMPGTARELGVDPADLHANVRGGAAYLSQLGRRFGGDLALTLSAYNAGPGAVARHGGVPPYAQTRGYVRAIMARLALTPPPVTEDASGPTP